MDHSTATFQGLSSSGRGVLVLALALGLASYHDSYYHGTMVASTMVLAVLVLVSSAEARTGPLF